MRNRLAFVAVLASCTAFALPLAAQSTVSFELFTTLPAQLSLPQYSTIGNVVAGDFNNDGKLDLLTGGQNEPGANNQLGVLFSAGNGDGTFQGPVTALSTSQQPELAVDLNNDGNLDLITGSVANDYAPPLEGQLQIFYGKGNGTFDGPYTLAGNFSAYAAAVGDLNGDGLQDIAFLVNLGTGSTPSYEVVTYLNTGGQAFVPGTVVPLPQVASVESLQVADVDEDGHPDLIIGSGWAGNGTLTAAEVAWGKGADQFTQPVVLRSYAQGTVTTTVSDVNQDGAPDIVANYCPLYSGPGRGGPGSQSCGVVDVFYGGQGKQTTFYRNAVNDASVNELFSPVAVDVNGDGIADLVSPGVDQTADEGLFVWLGHPDGSFDQTHQRFIVTTNYVRTALPGDFNRDGKMDFFVQENGTMYLNATATAPCATSQISPTVVVCQPVNNTYVPASALTVKADAHDTTPVTALQEYVDGDLVTSDDATSFSLPLGEAPGAHLLVTKAWDAKGVSFRSNRNVTVYSGTPGSVCAAPQGGAAICLPSDNTGGTTHVVANGSTQAVPDAVQLYVDGNLTVNNTTGGSTAIDTRLSLNNGTHTLVFKLWDANGNVTTAQSTVTVQ